MRSPVCLRSFGTSPELRAGNGRRRGHGRDHPGGHRRRSGNRREYCCGQRRQPRDEWRDGRTRRWRDSRRAERRRRLCRRGGGAALEAELLLPGCDGWSGAGGQCPEPRRTRAGCVGGAGAGRRRGRRRRRPHLLDGNGCPLRQRRVHHAVQSGRHQRQDAGCRRRDLHPQAAQARCRRRQDVLVRSRRDAGHASQPRRLQRRGAGDDGADRHRSNGQLPVVRGDRARPGPGARLLVAEGTGQWARRVTTSRAHRHPRRTDAGHPHRHRDSVRPSPEPIDIDLDLAAGYIYWTDRADNTVSRAPIEIPARSTAATRTDQTRSWSPMWRWRLGSRSTSRAARSTTRRV